MELPELNDPEGRLRRVTRLYGEFVIQAIILLMWTVIAFVALCAAYIVVTATWRFLHILLELVC